MGKYSKTVNFADLGPSCIGQLSIFDLFAMVGAQNTVLGGWVCPKSEFSMGKYSKTVKFAELDLGCIAILVLRVGLPKV